MRKEGKRGAAQNWQKGLSASALPFDLRRCALQIPNIHTFVPLLISRGRAAI